MTKVLAFPRACSNCEWVAFAGNGDLFCLTWTAFVAEFDAENCEAYEPSGTEG